MPYITTPMKERDYQISFDDIMNGINQKFFDEMRSARSTRTVFRSQTPNKLKSKFEIEIVIKHLQQFNEKYENLHKTENKSSLFYSFKIPKRSGGYRPIDAPFVELKAACNDLKYILENYCFASYHSSAFAYIKGRCALDSVKKHQQNKSRWFLKIDFSNFFGSTTLPFLINQLETIFPFSEILSNELGRHHLCKALSLCFLNGGLPQGTPISPILTNIMMIPIDFTISKMAREHEPKLCYTRYADDIFLSSKVSFTWSEVQSKIEEILNLFKAPFSIKPEKTRYGSSAGRNWNLGVMLNKDNEITVGHEKKKMLKVSIFNFLNDYTNGTKWNLEDIQHLSGVISYYMMIEKENISKIIESYNKKFGVDVLEIIKEQIKKPI